MTEELQSFGVYGLAVMGANLALNVEEKGFSIAVCNRTPDKTKAFIDEYAEGRNVKAGYTLKEFVD